MSEKDDGFFEKIAAICFIALIVIILIGMLVQTIGN
jgi:hypothetical protein